MKNINFTEMELSNILSLIQDELEHEHWKFFNSEYKDSICSIKAKLLEFLKPNELKGVSNNEGEKKDCTSCRYGECLPLSDFPCKDCKNFNNWVQSGSPDR